MSSEKVPYSLLGERLKELRNLRSATTAEVSGAVEIDEKQLKSFESGIVRPSEDILVLLLNYFDLEENEAEALWQMAGYEPPRDEDDADSEDSEADRAEALKEIMKQGHTAVMMMSFDPRIIYSDGVDITANKEGVVLNFTQSGNGGVGPASRTPVSRVGMSYEQAQAVLEVMQKTLDQAKAFRAPKRLPPQSGNSPDSSKDNQK